MEHEGARMLWAQCWQVSLLILAVAIISRVWGRNRPHLAHGLWVVVLLKAITPPIWSSPGGVFSWLQPAHIPQEAVVMAEPEEPPVPAAPPIAPRTIASELLEGDWSADAEFPVIDAEEAPAPVPIIMESETVLPAEEIALESTSTDAEAPPAHKGEAWPVWSITCLAVWLAGMLGSLVLSVGRWIGCWREIRRAGTVHDPIAERLLHDLLIRLRVRRRVRLIISQSRIGPAVLGIFRPTVLIPARILTGKRPVDLEPILAHELIHVRRGDLWVGWLQVLVQAVWWFHPLVWWSGRLLKHEAERCCDEEVIAELQLKPGRYARALLDVLELKHVLRPVPVLPGVKPVEITSKRLERIMLLGQGCRKRTPWWCWLVMLLTAAFTLPGAAFIAEAKDKAKRVEKSKTENENELRTRNFQVGDVLERTQKDLGLKNDTATRTALAGHLKMAVGQIWNEESLLSSGQQVGTPSLRIKGNRLTVRHTSRVIEEIAGQLELIREHGFQQIVIETRIISVSDGFFERLGMDLDFDSKNVECLTSEAGAGEAVEKTTPLGMAILNDSQAKMFVEACQTDASSNLMFCPKVTVFNGQRAAIQDTVQRPFVVGMSSDGKPTLRIVESGTKIRLRAVWKGDHIRLESQLNFSDIRNVEVVDLPGSGEGEPSKVQVPKVATTRIDNTVKLPNGGSVLLGGIKQPREGRKTAGVPNLNKIPYLSRLFKNVEHEAPDQKLFVMLRVVHLENEDTLPTGGGNNGIEFTLPLGVRSAQTAARHAELEYQKALEANRRLPGAIPQIAVERLKLKLDQARLKVEQAEHELKKAGGGYNFGHEGPAPETESLNNAGLSRKHEPATLLFFTATWCGPCQQMNPLVSRLKREGFGVSRVDVDKERDLAQRYNVRSLPTFILVANGQEQRRVVGMQSEAQLRRMLPQSLAKSDPPKAMPFSTLPYHGQGIDSDTGIAGQIVLDEANFETANIEPPTDEEVLEAARKELEKTQEIPFLQQLERKNIRITKEKTSQSAEPPRMYPKIGHAQQHTAQFKCTVTYDVTFDRKWPVPLKTNGTIEQLVQIDKSVLVPVKAVPQPRSAPPKDVGSAIKDGQVTPSAYYLEDDVQYFPAGPEHNPTLKAINAWNEFVESKRRKSPVKDAAIVPSAYERKFAGEPDHKVRSAETAPSLQEIVEEFNELFKQKRYAEADTLAKKAQETFPENKLCELMRSRAQTAMGFGESETNPSQTIAAAAQRTGMKNRLPKSAEHQIKEQLEKKITLRFKETPLSEVWKHVATDAGINIVLDMVGLVEEGMKSDHPVTIDVENIKLSSALTLILQPLNLGFMVQDDVLKITSKTRAAGPLQVVTYPVADLVVPVPQTVTMDLRVQPEEPKAWKPMPVPPAREEFEGLIRPNPEAKNFDFDSLIKLITATIEPNTWAEKGGNGVIRPYEDSLSLVVRQTPKVHEELRDLLGQLRRLQDLQVALTVETIVVPDLKTEGLARLVTGKPVTLTPEEAAALKKSLDANKSAKISQAPKITLFNGQTLNLVLPTDDKIGIDVVTSQDADTGTQRILPVEEMIGLGLSPVISADRRFVRLGLTLNSDGERNNLAGKQVLLKDGQSLLIDVTPAGGKTVQDARKLSLITARIIVQEEEEELLGIEPD